CCHSTAAIGDLPPAVDAPGSHDTRVVAELVGDPLVQDGQVRLLDSTHRRNASKCSLLTASIVSTQPSLRALTVTERDACRVARDVVHMIARARVWLLALGFATRSRTTN